LLARNEADEWLRKGEVCRAAQQFENAVECFRRGLGIDPNHPDLQVMLGEMYFYVRQDFEKALSLFHGGEPQPIRVFVEKLGTNWAQNSLDLCRFSEICESKPNEITST
jgi:hypothetical protein